jgi:class 3 adenylate cyclase
LRPGQVLAVGSEAMFRLVESSGRKMEISSRLGTIASPCSEQISVLVGDIRGYTALLGSSDREVLQRAISRVFARLGTVIHDLGGEIKEYQGDSLLAFWETLNDASPSVPACRAALALCHRVEALARDPETWPFTSHPLHMDWAVATGPVSIQVFGQERPEEMSMVGEPVVLAYRIEKLANQETGPLLVCATTREEAGVRFEFGDLGLSDLTGFDHPVHLYRLLREINTEPVAMVERGKR